MFLKYMEEFYLEVEREFSYFIKEDSTPMSKLKPTSP
jgi:hypothetical protein